MCSDGVAVPPHGLAANFAVVIDQQGYDVALLLDVLLNGHLVFLEQVKDELVSSAELRGAGTFLALKLALVHPGALLILVQFRTVSIGVHKPVNVVLDWNRVVLNVQMFANCSPFPGQNKATNLAGVIDSAGSQRSSILLPIL